MHVEAVTPQRQAKALVVFFSRTGTNRLLAESIARACPADIEELREARSHAGALGWLRSGYEATYRLASPTSPLRSRPEAYDIVFVGSPTWNRAVSSPVRGFLRASAGKLKCVALFATCAEHGAEDVVAEMAGLLQLRPLATLAAREAEVRLDSEAQARELVRRTLRAWHTTLE